MLGLYYVSIAIIISAAYVNLTHRVSGQDLDVSDQAHRITIADFGHDARYPTVQLSYVDEHRLAVSFATRNPNFGLSNRVQRAQGSHLFKTLFIDPISGTVTSQQEWGSYEPFDQLIGVGDERFLVGKDQAIALYGPDLHIIAERPLVKTKFMPHFILLPSPSRRRLYVLQPNDYGQYQATALDAATLMPVGAFTLPAGAQSLTANEATVVYRLSDTGVIRKASLNGEQTQIFNNLPGKCKGLPTFISETLILFTGCRSVVVADSDGNVLKSIVLQGNPIWKVMLGVKAHSFCAETVKVGKGLAALDIAPSVSDLHLACFNDSTLQERFDLPLKWISRHRLPLSSAVAPDLSSAAFYDRGDVTIIPLPGNTGN